jgi:malonyl CoA-acyl carrier protein transacylase
MRLSAEVEATSQPATVSSTAAEEIEAAFRERVKYVATVDNLYQKAQRIIETSKQIWDPSAAALFRQP